jgi:GNAT superfamily N-acetyltransferase
MNHSDVQTKAPIQENVRVEPATIEDLPDLVELVSELMDLQVDFMSNPEAHERGLALILEQPNRGRIFVLRNDDRIFGMVNLLFTISTALGGLVILLEDFVIHPNHRGQGYGTLLLDYVKDFAKQKKFKRITLLTDKLSSESQNFFQKEGFAHSSMVPMRLMVDGGGN